MSNDQIYDLSDVHSAIERGFRDASVFVSTNPSGEQILQRIESLQRTARLAIENFELQNYRERENADKADKSMKSMLTCAFRACEELRIIEERTFIGRNNSGLIRAYYLGIEILLPSAVTVFRTKGQSDKPDYNIVDQVNIVDMALKVA